MTAADDQPTLMFPPAEEQPPRKRRRWVWVIVLLIVAALLAAAAVAAEWLARGAVTGAVRTMIVSQLDAPPDHPIDVEVEGIVLPQLISGRLDDVTVSSPDLSLGPVTGDVVVNITDVPIRADDAAGGGSATVRLDEQQLRALLSTVEGFPADAATIASPDIRIDTELSVFGAAVPVGVSLLPGAAEGKLTLAPQRLSVAGNEVSAEVLRDQFGGLVDPLVRTWELCIAEDVPAALTLTSVAVEQAEVVAKFDIDGRVVIDPALRQSGTCG